MPSPIGPRHVGLAAPSRHLLGFGIAFLDVDNDGRLDLLTANGHVNDYRPSIPYTMPIQLLRGGADGRLRDVSEQAGPPFGPLHLGRGLAAGDLDNDGRVDALVVVQNEPLVFLHNQTRAGHFVTLALEGTASNRDGVGASVVVVAGSERRVAQRVGGGSYQSAGDPQAPLRPGRRPAHRVAGSALAVRTRGSLPRPAGGYRLSAPRGGGQGPGRSADGDDQWKGRRIHGTLDRCPVWPYCLPWNREGCTMLLQRPVRSRVQFVRVSTLLVTIVVGAVGLFGWYSLHAGRTPGGSKSASLATSSPVRGNGWTRAGGRRLAFRPYEPMDTSGFQVVLSALEPWEPGDSLEKISESWREPGHKLIAKLEGTLEDARRAGDQRKLVAMLMTKSLLLNYEGEPVRSYEVLSEARSLLESADRVAQEFLFTIIYFQGVAALRRGEN